MPVQMTLPIPSQDQAAQAAQAPEQQASALANVTCTHSNEDGLAPKEGDPGTIAQPVPNVGHNDPCPCGSGKKYKRRQ